MPYAKAIGKDRARALSLAAAMCLPAEVADIGAATAFKQWLDALPAPVAEVGTADLGLRCFGEGKETHGGKQARDMSMMLARFGYGMEPDPRLRGEKPGVSLLLFRAANALSVATDPVPAFHHAALIAAVLASADPGPDAALVVSHLVLRLRLGAPDVTRLAVRQRLMRGRPLPAGRLKALAGGLNAEERTAIATMAVEVAAACGKVGRPTLAALERLYDAFGAERRGLYAALHQGAAATALPAAQPVVVEDRAANNAAFRIPPPPTLTVSTPPVAGAEGRHAVVIDMAKVDAILRETREVAAVLAPIYEDEASEPVTDAKPKPAVRTGQFPGLDAGHASLLEALSCRECWSWAEFEVQARSFGLMPGGAIETINEWAYDTLGDKLVEDGDPLTINRALLRDTSDQAA